MAATASCAFVLFGATGDLTRRKLLPALFRLFCEKMLPTHFAIVGFCLPHPEKPDYHDFVRWSLKEFVEESDKAGAALEEFVALTSFVPANFTDNDGYERLSEE